MLSKNIRNMRMALGISQDELAESLHVVRQTVSKWEKGLSVPDAALLRELARQLNTTVSVLLGKPANSAAPAESSQDLLMGAVDIGGTKVQIGLVTGNGTILGAKSFATDSREQTGEEAVDKIVEELLVLCAQANISLDSLCGIGVFCAGPVDTHKGTVENPYTLPGWEGLPLVQLLSDATGLPVKLENDANGALLGEVFARNIAHRRVLMVTIGTGIGVAFWDGEGLYRTGRYHPEMGHIIVTSRGPECYCGHRGCFESLCSGKAINDRAQAAGFTDFEDLLAHTQQESAQALLSEIQQNFQSGIWSLRVVFKPDVLILAGGFAKTYFPILQQVLTAPGENSEDFSGLAEILPESNVPNAALMGACMLPWKKKKEGDIPMKQYNSLKIVMIGAGSCCFCPATLKDILLSDLINSLPLEVCLMDIDARALDVSLAFAKKAVDFAGRKLTLTATTDLDEALTGADFVITAIEVDRYHYWSIDFHIPRRYGFRQVYGENGGPGGMFHTLRNLGPTLHIAHRMEALCPDAWLINYTNPEAKLVEAVSKLTSIRAVGVCHGFEMGVGQIAKILERDMDSLEVTGYGLNYFGWMTKITDKETGEDLYPLFRQKEAECHWLAEWDGVGLSRMMLRTYGLYPYPGTNHIGEYIAWSDEFLASTKIQYFFDPVKEKPWETKKPPRFVYDFSSNPTGIEFSEVDPDKEQEYLRNFVIGEQGLTRSNEYGIPIIEAIAFNLNRFIPSLNLLNKGQIPGIMADMCVEGPCMVDGDGIHPVAVDPLPPAVTAMINQQGAIHQLVIEAYTEKSKNKLLQAMLLDPTVSNYNNAVALIDEMFQREKEILPELHW